MDSLHHPPNDLVLSGSSAVLLYPTTREGIENAAELIRFEQSGRCLLVRDLDFRARLLRGDLAAETMVDEFKRSWTAEINAGYDVFEIIKGPYYAHLRELLASCIAQVNDDYAQFRYAWRA